MIDGTFSRRALIGGAGLLGGASWFGALAARAGSDGSDGSDEHNGHDGPAHAHGSLGTVGTVDSARNGFDPHQILTDFDGGGVSSDVTGRTVREYRFVAAVQEIEVAPGVLFEAWSYNGRVPGPTIRATQGDRIRVELVNASPHPHTIHFHGFHPAAMDGVPGAGEVAPGETFTYDFVAGPFGTHLYHCHALPLATHIQRGLYGAFIVDPPGGRPPAREMVFVLNAFDTDFDGENEVYAANTIAFAYFDEPIPIAAGELQRAHVVNITEIDPINSFHLHANFFQLYRTGTRLEPDELTDTVTMGQAERHMIEFTYHERGRFMFHAHQSEFVGLGWMSMFEVS
jgi:FtsP/CotA-like multicopper oxidase with cupredoxin domain